MLNQLSDAVQSALDGALRKAVLFGNFMNFQVVEVVLLKHQDLLVTQHPIDFFYKCLVPLTVKVLLDDIRRMRQGSVLCIYGVPVPSLASMTLGPLIANKVQCSSKKPPFYILVALQLAMILMCPDKNLLNTFLGKALWVRILAEVAEAEEEQAVIVLFV